MLRGYIYFILQCAGVVGVFDVAADGAAIDPVASQHNTDRLKGLNSSKKYLKGFWAVVGYLGIASNEPETGLRVLHGGGGTVGACHLDHVQSLSRIPAVQTRLVAWRMRPRWTQLLIGSRRQRRRELVRWRALWARRRRPWRVQSARSPTQASAKGNTTAVHSSTVRRVTSHTSLVWVGRSRSRHMACASFRARPSITQIVMNSIDLANRAVIVRRTWGSGGL